MVLSSCTHHGKSLPTSQIALNPLLNKCPKFVYYKLQTCSLEVRRLVRFNKHPTFSLNSVSKEAILLCPVPGVHLKHTCTQPSHCSISIAWHRACRLWTGTPHTHRSLTARTHYIHNCTHLNGQGGGSQLPTHTCSEQAIALLILNIDVAVQSNPTTNI